MSGSRVLTIVFCLGVIAGIAVVGRIVFGAGAPPEGPVAAVWDREACEFCRMHVGEPAFAAQLQTTDGEVYFFDDPGCLFELLKARELSVHEAYFRHVHEDRWLARDEVAFLETSPTPMGYGIAAVERGTEGALDMEAARRKVLAKRGR